MSDTISAETLKNLRNKRKLSQGDLVRITAENRKPVSPSTIKRIEDAKQHRRALHPSTIKALAGALGVTVGELTGKSSSPGTVQEHLSSYIPLRDKIDRQTDLSYQAVEAIYGIPRSAQIAMAPLFAALLAEASLKWRKERLEALGSIADRLDDLRGDNPLLLGAFARAWEAAKIEKESLDSQDVLGHRALKRLEEEWELASATLDHVGNYELGEKLPEEWVSPFLLFLKNYGGSFEKSHIKIEIGDEVGSPRMPNGVAEYRVGEAFIDEICGENDWARIAIEHGHFALADIPKELLSPDKSDERQAFLASQVTDDKKREHAKSRVEQRMSYLEARRQARLEHGLDSDGADAAMFWEGPFVVTDDLIEEELAILNNGGGDE
jgi:transcriptional regulator with XRE-family HTH domain